MASNVGEMSGMKDARHMILWLFFGLLPMLGSCDFRDMLDDYPVSGVHVSTKITNLFKISSISLSLNLYFIFSPYYHIMILRE